MKPLLIFLLTLIPAGAQVVIDIDAFGKELGEWNARGKRAADYTISDAHYRTYKPVVTATPGGGRFISVRIDNRRGFFSSDDHALLQVTLDAQGKLLALESSIHAQGKSVKSDVILTTGKEASALLGGDIIVNAGLRLAKDLSKKLAGQKKVEAGRVIYPAVIVHNYNKLMMSISYSEPPPKAELVTEAVEEPKIEKPEPPEED